MSSAIAYEFQFVGSYDESVFMLSPYASDELRVKVQNAVQTEVRFLSRFTQVNRIAQQVQHDNLTFKVVLSRS